MYVIYKTFTAGAKCPDNPWGEGATTLEWTVSSPPPFHTFEDLPVVHAQSGALSRVREGSRRRCARRMASEAQGGELLRASGLRDFWRLCKPNVMQLVIFTSAVAIYLAPGSRPSAARLHGADLHRPGCGGLGGDQQLVRRRHRRAHGAHPPAADRVRPDRAAEALAVGVTLAIISVMLMGLALNWLAAALLALTIAFYVFVYTMWLKRRTPQNIVIGGAAGALPPVVAWAAVTGEVTLLPVLMFAIIFLWTPPHFWALALYRTGDYDRVGVPMLPVVAGRRSTLRPYPGLHGGAWSR